MARVLITGCSSGIGRATAEYLAGVGHHVIATARNLDSLQGLHVAQCLALDVRDAASVAAAVSAAGDIDVLVNNAGVAVWAPLELAPMPEVERLFDTNVLGVIRMCQAVLPRMRARGEGRIIQISSGAARRPQPGVGLYCASKAALEAFSMATRIEMRAFGVDVCVVSMGATASELDRNRFVASGEGTDYAPMMNLIIERTRAVRGAAQSGETVARVVQDMILAERPPFRTYVGEDYAKSVEAMAHMSDTDFEDKVFATIRDAMPGA
ncbi:MAG: SDR family oxidoreductase [Hyphomonadaceae bacterium]